MEVDDVGKPNSTTFNHSKFTKLDTKFKEVYFDPRTSIKLGWLIDPLHDEIWVYERRSTDNTVFRRHHNWGDLDGGDTLQNFKQKV